MSLSRTEERVIELRYQGNTYKEMEQILGASVNTIKTHCRRAKEKMGAKSLPQAIYIWRENKAKQMELAV